MKSLFQNKKVKIGILVVVLLIAVLGSIVAARRYYNRQQVQKHLATAEKYLLEMDYEQAIVEYTLALSIDPKNQEIRNALEKVYLDYAQSYIDEEKYDEALEVLHRGYDQMQTEMLLEKIDETERKKAEKEEAAEQTLKEQEEIQKQQEEAQRQQEEVQKQAENEKREEEKKRKEELAGIYKWEISKMEIMDFPVVVSDPYGDGYGFSVQSGMNEEMQPTEEYTVYVGEDGNVKVNGIEQDYDFAVTDEMKEEYAAYLENQKVFDEYAELVANYVRDAYFVWYGAKVVLQYHPEYSRVTDCEKDSDVFEGKIVMGRDGFDPLYVTCRVDLSNHEAEIVDIDTRYSADYDDESDLLSLIGQKIEL